MSKNGVGKPAIIFDVWIARGIRGRSVPRHVRRDARRRGSGPSRSRCRHRNWYRIPCAVHSVLRSLRSPPVVAICCVLCVARWVEVLLVCGCRVAIVEVPVASEQALPVVVTDTESGASSLALSRSAPARLVCCRPSICPHLPLSTVQSPASVALFSPGAVCPAVFYVSRLILVAFVPF